MFKMTHDFTEANIILIDNNELFNMGDIFSIALLLKLNPLSTVCILESMPENFEISEGVNIINYTDTIFETRETSNIKYSNFGMFWKEYGIKFVQCLKNKDLIFEKFDQNFVQFIDSYDNKQLFLYDDDDTSINSIIQDIELLNLNSKNLEEREYNLKNIVEIAFLEFNNILDIIRTEVNCKKKTKKRNNSNNKKNRKKFNNVNFIIMIVILLVMLMLIFYY